MLVLWAKRRCSCVCNLITHKTRLFCVCNRVTNKPILTIFGHISHVEAGDIMYGMPIVKRTGIFLIAASLLVPSIVLESYATNESGGVSWELVYIAGETNCDTFDKIMMETYAGLTTEYLALYELDNSIDNATCVTENEFEAFEFADEADLLIIVFDEVIGEKKMARNSFDGFYMHTGNDRSQNHVIMVCHCSNFENAFEQKLPSWILTHELSHFVLSLKGYDYGAVERLVHAVDSQYDKCIAAFSDECDDKTLLKPTTFTQPYLVFPVLQIALDNKPMQILFEETTNDTILLNVHKEITRWWINDLITDDVYLNATKQIFISPTSSYAGLKLQTGVELPNGIVMLDHAKNKPKTWQTNFQAKLTDEEKIHTLLEYIPEKIKNAELKSISSGEIPNFFKYRAQYWVDGKISDKQFFDSLERIVRTQAVSFN